MSKNLNFNNYDINEMEARVMELREKARNQKAEANGAIDTQIRMAEAQLEHLKSRLKTLGEKADAASDDVKSGVQKAWKDLRTSVERAGKYFN